MERETVFYKTRPLGKFIKVFLDGTTYNELKEKARQGKRKITKEASLRIEDSLIRTPCLEDD